MDDKLICLLLLSTCVAVTWGAMAGTHRCEAVSGAASSFLLTVRLSQGGNTAVSGITFFDATDTNFASAAEASTDSACITAAVLGTSDIYQLQFTVDTTGALPCGIVKVGTTNVYNVAYRADPDEAFFYGTCDLDDLLGVVVTSDVFQPGNIPPPYYQLPHRRSLQMSIVLNGADNVPTDNVQLGRKLRAIVSYQRGQLEDDTTTGWGNMFHTGFLHNDAGVAQVLQLVTRGPIGARVKIIGNLGGALIDEEVDVPAGTVVSVQISNDYMPTSTAAVWKKETKGLVIMSPYTTIGVMALTSNVGTSITDTFRVFPDTMLGTSYRVESADTTGSQVLVMASQSGTTAVTIQFTGTAPSVTVGGTPATTSTAVSITEYETLHLYCGTGCDDIISISADKKIAVISGAESASTTLASQIPPTTNFGSTYVFIVPGIAGSHSLHFKARTSTAAGPTQNKVVYGATGGPITSTALDDSYKVSLTGVAGSPLASEVQITQPTAAVPYMVTLVSEVPGWFVPVPAISQWGVHQYVPLDVDMSYDVHIVSTTSALGSVTDSVDGRLDSIAGFAAALVDVSPADGGAVVKSLYVHSIPTVTTSSIREFTAGNNVPFMALVVAKSATSGSQIFIPNGMRNPIINPCVPTTMGAGSPLASATGLTMYNQSPGDGIDNDCDGQVDEEFADAEDDDGDGLFDEDTTIIALDEFADVHGVYVDELYACDTAACDNLMGKIISGGCNIAPAVSSANAMGNFVKDVDLVSANPNYWVDQTSAFPAFRFDTQQKVHFRAKVKFCFDDAAALCVDSCTARRRRRDVTNSTSNEASEWLGFSINIIDPTIEDPAPKILPHPCLEDAGYWAMVVGFLVVIVIEVTAFVIVRLKLTSATKTLGHM